MTEPQRDIRQAVRRRLARRHRAERRFQAYGVAALAAAGLFLVLLLGSIAIQSAPAITQHKLTLPVEITAELADPRGDLSEASLRRGSYNTLIQNALREQFPTVAERAELRELFGLYSGVNAARLLNRVASAPELVGGRVEFTFPISDDADLYLKGVTVRERIQPGLAPIAISAEDTDRWRLVSDTPVFAEILVETRQALSVEAAGLERRRDDAVERAEAARDEDARRAASATAERLDAQLQRLRIQAQPDQALQLGPTTKSVLVQVGDGVYRLTGIGADGASASAQRLIGEVSAGAVSDWRLWTVLTPPTARLISDRQIAWARALSDRGLVENGFNTILFTRADSREPELAGVLGAIIGSVLTMVITMLLAVPVGVGTAIYLEEYAPKNRLTDLIEVNINNLAAVPSIVFGLLGLAVFINLFGMPRSAPLTGGMVLALMTLPTVIISSRAALRAVPPSIREAALGVGASHTQAVFHHVLPMAMPGILTGSIIGLAQALGETAPLLMIGMVAFIADAPALGFGGFTDAATVMPVQIFLWSSGAERAFEARTAAAILVLLAMMLSFNAVAIYLRRRFERRW
ncbi:MAG: phosphate ABC transporter permease PstA [Pseudomonadota bacterium]